MHPGNLAGGFSDLEMTWAQIHRYLRINLKKTTGFSVNLSSVVLRHLKGDRNILS